MQSKSKDPLVHLLNLLYRLKVIDDLAANRLYNGGGYNAWSY